MDKKYKLCVQPIQYNIRNGQINYTIDKLKTVFTFGTIHFLFLSHAYCLYKVNWCDLLTIQHSTVVTVHPTCIRLAVQGWKSAYRDSC